MTETSREKRDSFIRRVYSAYKRQVTACVIKQISKKSTDYISLSLSPLSIVFTKFLLVLSELKGRVTVKCEV